jgi:hypothetical protein
MVVMVIVMVMGMVMGREAVMGDGPLAVFAPRAFVMGIEWPSRRRHRII